MVSRYVVSQFKLMRSSLAIKKRQFDILEQKTGMLELYASVIRDALRAVRSGHRGKAGRSCIRYLANKFGSNADVDVGAISFLEDLLAMLARTS